MATFWQGNWARSPQQQSGLQQISQSVPPPEKPSPHTTRKKKKPEEQEKWRRQKNKKEEVDRRTRKKKQALRKRIYSAERKTLSYGLKGKKAQERKTGSQEKSTRKKTRSQERSTRKKHRTTYNTKQNLTTKNNTYRLQKRKNIQRKGKFPLPASPHPVSSFQVRSIVLPALRCTFWSPGPNSNIPLPVFNLITSLIPPFQPRTGSAHPHI